MPYFEKPDAIWEKMLLFALGTMVFLESSPPGLCDHVPRRHQRRMEQTAVEHKRSLILHRSNPHPRGRNNSSRAIIVWNQLSGPLPYVFNTGLYLIADFTGGNVELFLEHPGKVLGIRETECIGNLSYREAFHQHFLGPLHEEMPDIQSCAFAGTGTDQIPEIIRRQEQSRCAETDGGDS